ncbi:MAG: T9SS type A sorting domain-containing protein, partial [bacterium]
GPVYTESGNCGGAPMTKAGNDSGKEETSEMADVATPESYALSQNYPNPFNPTTDIRFALPEAGHVVLKIFNTLGENIVTLVDEDFAVGAHTVHWNAQNARGQKVPSGVYFYQLNTSGFTETKRMVLAK